MILNGCTLRVFHVRQRFSLSLLAVLAFTSSAAAGISGTSLVAWVDTPLFATHAPGDASRLFIAERDGTIQILDLINNQVLPTPFLNINDVDTGGEGGLLGLAFHPDYANNGKFYTYSTRDNGGVNVDGFTSPFSTHVREYEVSSSNPNIANASSQREILNFPRAFSNHVGGWIGFGPNDGHLYIASGDSDIGSYAVDRINNLFGKMLRIDIDGDDFPTDANRNYAIPNDNPLVGVVGDDEIWSEGLRNPFRASFDRANGDLWIADVGEGSREEINQLVDGSPFTNFGWPDCEGNLSSSGCAAFKNDPNNASLNIVDPVYDYSHLGQGPSGSNFRGNSVTGGYVYRGPDPELQGKYFFTDFVSNNYWMFDPSDPYGTVEFINSDLFDSGVANNATAFAEDAHGNLYILSISGGVYRIDTDALAPGDYNGDGLIDNADYQVWQSNYGSTSDLAADGNSDGVVNAADYTVWRDNVPVSSSAASAEAVPEPASFLLILMFLAGLTSFSRN